MINSGAKSAIIAVNHTIYIKQHNLVVYTHITQFKAWYYSLFIYPNRQCAVYGTIYVLVRCQRYSTHC
jgi:hypothetical protein